MLPTSVPLLGVLGHRSQCVGPGFSFFWEKLRTASVSQATLWIDGGRTSWLGDLGCFVRPQWRVAEGGALLEAIWGPNSMARQGLPPPGPRVGGRAEPRRGPEAALCPAPRLHPAPRPRPTPHSHRAPLQPSSGRAPALWDRLSGDGAGAGEEAAFLQIT